MIFYSFICKKKEFLGGQKAKKLPFGHLAWIVSTTLRTGFPSFGKNLPAEDTPFNS